MSQRWFLKLLINISYSLKLILCHNVKFLVKDKRIKCTFTKTTQLILAPHEHGGDEEGMGSTAGAFTNTGVITSLAM